jgi:hypothetical protein
MQITRRICISITLPSAHTNSEVAPYARQLWFYKKEMLSVPPGQAAWHAPTLAWPLRRGLASSLSAMMASERACPKALACGLTESFGRYPSYLNLETLNPRASRSSQHPQRVELSRPKLGLRTAGIGACTPSAVAAKDRSAPNSAEAAARRE